MAEDGTQGAATIRALLAAHGVDPRRRYGQNFLADPNTVRKIVRLAGVGPDDQVVEIGAGTGALTVALAGTGASIVAYEVDPGLAPLLRSVLAGIGDVVVRIEDAAEIDLDSALAAGTWQMVANLPYNVGTGILLDALRRSPRIARFVVMVQREVADRLLAGPGTKVYGLPSVVAALHARSRLAFPVPASVFYPRPRVNSAVVELVREEPPRHADSAVALAAAAFGKRRKMLRTSLAGVLPDPGATLAAAGIEGTRRAEELSASDFVAIAEAAA